MTKELSISQKEIENQIYTIRGIQVMLDSDLAEIYNVSTGRLNEQVKRNLDRFPDDFMFQLSQTEWEHLRSQIATTTFTSQNAILKEDNLKSQNAISSAHGGRRKLPFVFTEQGVAGLSGVLKSETAAKIHVAIMRAFVALRKLIQENQLIYSRLDKIELKQLQTDQKFEKVFKALERKDVIPHQGVFFNGQVFDAYELASKIIRTAKQNILLIDNFINESTLTHLSKKEKSVRVLLLTKAISKQISLDVQKANEQYGDFELKIFTQSHDRFLIIDQTEVYHLGASLKDLGRKWFAFSKMDKSSVESIMSEISELI
ncbi:MAG: ORF6N domain-containing protein [Bacteroidales bacterium]|nr:ORF6N domain-containing protein [Bacteroidales bacterium]